ncbi:MAG: ribonuclease III [Lachnospiraceae bacterium]|nr:ribonuclease III [Lachnospiraceae bacterium]
MKSIREFQREIGYEFKDESLLKQALTHSSYANEKHMKRLSDNERLEFLGDAILEAVSSEFLYLNYKEFPEGDLTRLRASMVCEPTLAFCTKDIHLGDYVFLGKGEELTGGRQRKSVLSDAMEAVIGAIFLDGGFEEAKKFILTYIMTDIEHKRMFYDSKTILQEVCQGQFKQNVTYELLSESGPDHAKTFTVQVLVGKEILGTGTGNTKKSAEQEAAYHGLIRLKKQDEGKII